MVHAVRTLFLVLASALTLSGQALAASDQVPLNALGRFDGWRENALIGYGIVVGLAGSGDSARNGVTRQALSNVYSRLGATVSQDDISGRNVAVVIVSARLPASANVGDQIGVTVASAGDARSLAGGVLLMTPLLGPDGRAYALAQGPLIAGGYSFDSELNLAQRNYPTTARIEAGATVEQAVQARLLNADRELVFLLSEPNHATAARASAAINDTFGSPIATALGADEVRIRYRGADEHLTQFVAWIEAVTVQPARTPRVVINERTGTIVAGGDVTISSVVIAQDDIRVTITSDVYASQPAFISGFASDVSSLLVTNTELEVRSGEDTVVASFDNTTIADLVQGLSEANVDTRRTISILQAIKAAGALNAEIVVQ